MRILFAVANSLPNPEGGHGCPVMSWAMVQWLKEAGHEIHVCAFSPTAAEHEPLRERGRQYHQELGIPLHELALPAAFTPSNWPPAQALRRVFSPRLSDYWGVAMAQQSDWRRLVENIKPDAFWLYSTDAVALAHNTFPKIPRLASLIDLEHEARALKRDFRAQGLRNAVRNQLETRQDRALPELLGVMLKPCEVVVEHSITATQWLNERGIAARYLPNPVNVTLLAQDWYAERSRLLAQTSVKKILMVGHLRGVATRTGLRLLVQEILPHLERLRPAPDWEIHIVGGGELLPELQAQLTSHPRVKLRGFVPDLTAEYQQAYLTLVAVSEKIGFRTRLVEAFAHHAPCVVHVNNRYGMPELLDEQNSLLADTGRGLAERMAGLLNDAASRQRLEQAARATYDQHLSNQVVMTQMHDWLAMHVTRTTSDTSPKLQLAQTIA